MQLQQKFELEEAILFEICYNFARAFGKIPIVVPSCPARFRQKFALAVSASTQQQAT